MTSFEDESLLEESLRMHTEGNEKYLQIVESLIVEPEKLRNSTTSPV
jgi:hypothetical protein